MLQVSMPDFKAVKKSKYLNKFVLMFVAAAVLIVVAGSILYIRNKENEGMTDKEKLSVGIEKESNNIVPVKEADVDFLVLDLLSGSGLEPDSPDVFRDEVEEDILRKNRIIGRFREENPEYENATGEETIKAFMDKIAIEASVITDEEIETYYEKNRERFGTRSIRSLRGYIRKRIKVERQLELVREYDKMIVEE